MLLRVPKGAGGAKSVPSAVTAAITGTTVMVETHAADEEEQEFLLQVYRAGRERRGSICPDSSGSRSW